MPASLVSTVGRRAVLAVEDARDEPLRVAGRRQRQLDADPGVDRLRAGVADTERPVGFELEREPGAYRELYELQARAYR